MILYTHSNTPRLQYILDFIDKELNLGGIQITSTQSEFSSYDGAKINYSPVRINGNEFWIKPHSLLFETGITSQTIECFISNERTAFFKTEGDLQFDIFAASFYLLSRYEEYLPHSKDMYGRYAFENSLAYKQNFLDLPLVNIWLQDLLLLLKSRFPLHASDSRLTTHDYPLPTHDSPLPTRHSPLAFLPTYDIDLAWSYKHKGWWRNTGGFLRSFLKGEWSSIAERIRVLMGRQQDPFDAFAWMNQLHERHKLNPYYFFLVPESRGRYDKNISPRRKPMQDLIKNHVIRYPIGIHPSWKSGDDISLLKKEIETLAHLNGNTIVASRQHYIRFNLPDGYRKLIANGIRCDFSMGYGSINGFRASVCSPFYWYDLEKEKQTGLLLFPFCFMEANSFYEQHYSPQQALDEMRQYYKTVRDVNGYFIMIWHNSFLGTDKLYAGWREVYQQFIQEVSFSLPGPENGLPL